MHRLALKWGGIAVLVALAIAVGSPGRSQQPKGITHFENKIRPVLINHCYECHSAASAKVRGGLVLDTKDGILRGGDSGPALVPGHPEKSLLIKALNHDGLKMPKKPLPRHIVADFELWVKMGAPDPRTGAGSAYKRMTAEEAKSFWSLKPLRKPTPPIVAGNWAKSDIDRFILAGLQAKKLTPTTDADRRVLLRRLTYDLTGLPPTTQELDAFLGDKSDKAVEKVVDRLLSSPRFGERWGRYWLDLARYAESNGNADNVPFPQAWRYRDYVIKSFNEDKPYDQFISEQIAGDLLKAKDSKRQDEMLVATGFLALTSKPRPQNNPNYRMDLVADQIDVTTRSVLGLTVMCARCHDHKFDPISTKEYYALAGIFDSSQMLAGAAGKKAGKKAVNTGLHTLAGGGKAMGVKDGQPKDCNVCLRGESNQRGEKVKRGFIGIATLENPPSIPSSTSGRLQLAQWLTAKSNPLTARVAVNRIWMHLFGQGLVKSPDNFGSLGEKPSHPELLDWMAATFMEQGWSTKKMIRQIVLSRTYQLSSNHHVANYRTDPDNVSLWRMNARRLDAEAIRDGMLAVSGTLDLTPPQGSLVGTFAGPKNRARFNPSEQNNRSVYLGIPRGSPLPESLALFDVANPNLVVAQREVTTVPAQALYLMNSPFILKQSRALAKRLEDASGLDTSEKINLGYRLAFSRLPTTTERERVQRFLGDKPTSALWVGFAQVLLASAEFRYLD